MVGVPEEEWATPEILSWKEADIARLLDIAEAALKEVSLPLHLRPPKGPYGLLTSVPLAKQESVFRKQTSV